MSRPTDPPRLFVSHDRALRRLVAVEYGRVAEDQPHGRWHVLTDDFTFLFDEPGGRAVGFLADDPHDLDLDEPDLAPLWDGPRFHAPALGLPSASAGEVVLAARRHFGERSSVDRTLHALATGSSGREAVARWTHCLEAGDASAHHPLGRTLLELGHPVEAYAHLRHHAELAPAGAWNWNLLGRAAEAIGETVEARRAYLRAIELAPPDGHAGKVDAAERLAGLDRAADASDRRV